ncbi:MAG TPA: hypothetical protein VFN37_04300 [Candidatus Baltobacteraceae bacterium]|nr:hypothetical protein [Candidatus Baltobacteraceae bacterium]
MIEQTADLLSADYPLDLLIERLCDTLAAAFDASSVFVALACADGQLRSEKDGRIIDRNSSAHETCRSGQSLLHKSGESKMYVPISCRSDVFGVVGMLRNAENYYTPSLGAQEALAFLRLHVAGVHV